VRDYSAHLYNRGFNKEERWAQVLMTLVPRFAVPKKPSDVRGDFERSNAEMEERLGPPAALPSRDNVVPFPSPPADPVSEAGGESNPWVKAGDLMAELEAAGPVPFIFERMVVMSGLNLMGGHPKVGKSLAVMQMGACYATGQDFLGQKTWTGGVPLFLYLTQEGSRAEMLKRLTRLSVAYPGITSNGRYRVWYMHPFVFDKTGWGPMAASLDAIEAEFKDIPAPLGAWLVIDPLRDAMPPGTDENEAKDIAPVKAFCRALLTRYPWLTITLVHHVRKSASGDTGAELAGSGATWGMADSTFMWRGHHDTVDNGAFKSVRMYGTYFATTRGDEPAAGGWSFEPASGLMVPRGRVEVSDVESGEVEVEYDKGRNGILAYLADVGAAGTTPAEVADALDMKDGTVRMNLLRLGREDKVVRVDGRYYLPEVNPLIVGGLEMRRTSHPEFDGGRKPFDEGALDDEDLPSGGVHDVPEDSD
jgi:hypothetical protein